jgi:uncharacterized protein (TIGR03435 family)
MRRAAAITMFVAIGIVAQPQLQIDITSLKLHTGDGRGPEMRGSPGGFSLKYASLRDMIRAAYGVRDFQIVGGPDWIDSDHYDFEAKARVSPSQMHVVVVQAVLQDRFKLKSHRETRELPVYVLTVAKGGPRMRQSKEGSCTPFDGAGMPPRFKPGDKPFCGVIKSGISLWLNKTIDAVGIKVADSLTTFLSNNLNRTVIDQTGLTGKYDIHLEWNRQAANEPGSPAPSADEGPSLITAVQDQLGLKLEPGRGPVKVLVIDRVERPDGN